MCQIEYYFSFMFISSNALKLFRETLLIIKKKYVVKLDTQSHIKTPKCTYFFKILIFNSNVKEKLFLINKKSIIFL